MSDEQNSAAQEDNTDAADNAGQNNQQTTDDAADKLYDQSQGQDDGSKADDSKADDDKAGADDGKGGDDKGGSDDDKGDKDKSGDDDAGDSDGAPESYEAFDLPEDFQLEGERLEQATEFFKSHDMNQEQAQSSIDLYLKMREQEASMQADAFAEQQKQWKEELAKDEEFGGEKLDATKAMAQKAVQTIAPELAEWFEETGFGNDPRFVRGFAKIGAIISEDSFDLGSSGSGKDALKDLYDKSDHA